MADEHHPAFDHVIALLKKSQPHRSTEDLRRELLKRIEPKVYPDPMEPPWVACPNVPGWPSMGWRMGAGEDYLDAFAEWFRSLSAERCQDYIESNPEPDGFSGLYTSILKSRRDPLG